MFAIKTGIVCYKDNYQNINNYHAIIYTITAIKIQFFLYLEQY